MGYISMTIGGDMVGLDAPDREHRFYGYCIDSSLAHAVLWDDFQSFVTELYKRTSPPTEWSPLAKDLARESGVAVVQINTLSESPVAKARRKGETKGTVITETLVQELSQLVAERISGWVKESGAHAPGDCEHSRAMEALCPDCEQLAGPLESWPLEQQARLGGLVVLILRALATRGLLP